MAGEGLLLALQSGQYKPSEDPYGIAAQVIGSSAPALVNPYASTGSNIGSVVGAGLLSALLAGLARNSTNEANAELLPIQQQILSAPADQRAAILQGAGSNGARLSPLVSALAQQDYLQKAEIDAAVNKERALMPLAEQKAGSAAATDLLKNKGQAMLGGQLVQILDPVAQAEAAAAASARGGVRGTNEGYGFDASQNPDSPQAKLSRQIADQEDKMRAEILKIPAVAQVENLEKSLPMLEPLKDLPTKSSDNAFVYNYIKALDDGAVRGEEIDLANTANPILMKFRNQLESAFSGGTQLGVDLKNQMFNELIASKGSIYAAAMDAADRRIKIGESRGLSRAGMLPIQDRPPVDQSAALEELKRRGKL